MTEQSATTQDIQSFVKRQPWAESLGMIMDEATPERVRAHLDWSAGICTAGGIMHGGAFMTFGDSVGAICAMLNLPEGAGTTTTSSSTVFIRGLREGGTAYATAVPLQAGRTVIVVRTEITDQDGKLLSQVTQSQAVLQPRS